MEHVVTNTSGQGALDKSKAARTNHNQVYMLVFRCLHDDVSWLTTFRRNFTRYLKHRYDEHYSTCTEQEPTVTRTNTQNLHLSVHVHVHTLWSPTWAPAGFLGGWTQSFSSPNTFCTEAAGYTDHLHFVLSQSHAFIHGNIIQGGKWVFYWRKFMASSLLWYSSGNSKPTITTITGCI